MNLELYRSFYFVAKSKSISKASEQLYISQPAVSRAIKQLEYSLGCTLFFRTSKGVELTNEGEILFRNIDIAFNFIESAEKKLVEVIGLKSGEIRIGASDTLCKYYLVPYLKLFKAYYPNIKVHVSCPTTPGIIQLLKSGKIDFGIINMPYEDDQLSFKNIMEIQDCFIVGQKYKFLSGSPRHITEIVTHPMLLLEKNSNTRTYIDKYFQQHSLSIIPDFELANMDQLAHFAKYEFGIACVIENFIESIIHDSILYKINLIEKIPPRSISVVWLKNMPLSSAAKELIKQLEYIEPTEF